MAHNGTTLTLKSYNWAVDRLLIFCIMEIIVHKENLIWSLLFAFGINTISVIIPKANNTDRIWFSSHSIISIGVGVMWDAIFVVCFWAEYNIYESFDISPSVVYISHRVCLFAFGMNTIYWSHVILALVLFALPIGEILILFNETNMNSHHDEKSDI